MQFFGPDKNIGDTKDLTAFYTETNPSKEVKLILTESCMDCHSSNTRYPWYNSITPVNYWLADHIEHGKGHLDFSKWKDYSVKRKDHKFEEITEMVEKKEMPLNSYKWTHEDANLNEEQIKNVINWTNQVRIKYSLSEKPQ